MKKSKPKTTEVGDQPPLIFKQQVLDLLGGISPSTLWLWMKAGAFPLPVELGPGGSRSSTIAWRSAEVHSWIANRPRRKIGKNQHEFRGIRSDDEPPTKPAK